MAARHLSVRVEKSLRDALEQEARERGVPLGAVVRDALRRGLGVATAERSGWLEGFKRAYADSQRASLTAQHAVAGGRR